ncbi:MAG: recombination mediator RecR [Gammaproteobacteria bacterium]|nr:recombination mediator RecR [Gammaproteobacteria bacterium]
MASLTPRIEQVINALQCLPGVGRKTATRMTLFLLQGHRDDAAHIATSIDEALATVTSCATCHNLSDAEVCDICADAKRANGQLCVVETAADLVAIEETGTFQGRYFVLHGLLSPIDGMGPDELNLGTFLPCVRDSDIREVIVALNATVEGEATTHFIGELLEGSGISLSQLAHGIPVGGELGYVNSRTIAQAFQRRVNLGA